MSGRRQTCAISDCHKLAPIGLAVCDNHCKLMCPTCRQHVPHAITQDMLTELDRHGWRAICDTCPPRTYIGHDI